MEIFTKSKKIVFLPNCLEKPLQVFQSENLNAAPFSTPIDFPHPFRHLSNRSKIPLRAPTASILPASSIRDLLYSSDSLCYTNHWCRKKAHLTFQLPPLIRASSILPSAFDWFRTSSTEILLFGNLAQIDCFEISCTLATQLTILSPEFDIIETVNSFTFGI